MVSKLLSAEEKNCFAQGAKVNKTFQRSNILNWFTFNRDKVEVKEICSNLRYCQAEASVLGDSNCGVDGCSQSFGSGNIYG